MNGPTAFFTAGSLEHGRRAEHERPVLPAHPAQHTPRDHFDMEDAANVDPAMTLLNPSKPGKRQKRKAPGKNPEGASGKEPHEKSKKVNPHLSDASRTVTLQRLFPWLKNFPDSVSRKEYEVWSERAVNEMPEGIELIAEAEAVLQKLQAKKVKKSIPFKTKPAAKNQMTVARELKVGDGKAVSTQAPGPVVRNGSTPRD